MKQPAGMSLEEWQLELRRQFGADQDYRLKNLGDDPIFSEFQVTNPKTGGDYRVAIRGEQPGVNYCSCGDFATNTLGTCKHVEFTLAKLRKRTGGKKALAAGHQPPYSEVYLQYGAEREVRLRLGADCPVELARLAAKYFDAEGRLPQEAMLTFDRFLSKTADVDHRLEVYNDALAYIAEVRDAARRQEILAREFPRGVRSASFKNLLKLPLYEYQREGALFAARAGRSLLGDEMGLGKTVQAIAAAEIMARHLGVERVLVVCPTSLKYQWEQEIARLSGRSAEVIGGLRPARAEGFRSASFFKILNYDTIHRDLDLITDWSPELVILDEAQRIKNWDTRAARFVKRIQSPYCLVLTGTPLENRLEELVSIVEFIDRHRLGPTFRFLHEHQVRAEKTGRVVGYRNLDRVSETLAPILIRRRKDQVLQQLPERLEKRLLVPMTPQQMQHHDENKEIVARLVSKWQRTGFLTESEQRRLMICLQNMRMSCDSTYLLDKQTDHGVKADELATMLEEIFEQPRSKVVIFSQWVRMHELVERRFDARGWNRVLFHGGVESSKRKDLVSRFREDPACRAFLSTDAGGVGLNLQHANVIVNLDLPWNPAVLEQRIGRVHRMGQSQPVSVLNFISQGTIEEGMLSLLKFKKSLFAGVLDGGEKEIFLGESRLKQFIQSVQQATSAIPESHTENDAAAAGEETADQGASTRRTSVTNDSWRRSGVQSAAESCDAAPAAALTSNGDDNPLAAVLQGGLLLLERLVAATRSDASGSPGEGGGRVGPIEVVRGEPGGGDYLKLPLPKPELLNQALQSIGKLLEGMR